MLVGITDAKGHKCQKDVEITINPVAPSILGYYLCGWHLIEQALHDTVPAPCGPDNRPHWNGVFDKLTTWSPPNNFQMWYFTGQSLFGAFYAPPGIAISADQAPDYPGGDWQNLDTFAQLIWDGVFGWFLMIADTCGNIIWEGAGGFDINDASGEYPNDLGGTSPIPTVIHVSKVTNPLDATENCITDCAQFSIIDWLCNPGTCRLRILGYTPAFIWPDCASFTTPGADPVWDGTFDVFAGGNIGDYNTTPKNVIFNTNGSTPIGTAQLVYNPSLDQWEMVIGLGSFGFALWAGTHAGTDPLGVYNQSATLQCASGVASFTVVAYTPP